MFLKEHNRGIITLREFQKHGTFVFLCCVTAKPVATRKQELLQHFPRNLKGIEALTKIGFLEAFKQLKLKRILKVMVSFGPTK